MSQSMMTWVAVLAYSVGVLLTQTPVLNPDALEMGLVGQAYFGADDLGLDLHHYPPAFPMISAVMSLMLPLDAAILVIAPLAFCGVLFALSHLLKAQNRMLAAAVLIGVFWTSPELTALSVSPDPRGLQLAFFFGGMVLVLRAAQPGRGILLGGVAGLLVLTRPEGFLFASLLLGAAVIRWKRRSVATMACFSAVVLPYLWMVSRAVGSLSLNSRAWEIKGSGLLELLPVRSLIHLWGAGAQTTPFREVLRDLGPQSAVPQESFFGSLGAAASELGSSMLPMWWLPAIWGVLLLWRTRRMLLLLLSGTVAVSMMLYLVPMGRDLALPLINLLPAVVALHLLAVFGILDGLRRLRPQREAGARVVTAAVLLSGIWALHRGADHRPSESYSSAVSWMKTNLSDGERVASSLGSAPLVHQARHSWVRIPSRWERAVSWKSREHRPDYLILTSTDGLWMMGPPTLDSGGFLTEPVAFFRDSRGWVLVLELGKEPRARHLHKSGVVVEGL